jgi:ABC-type multidrug transport system ATPase subunit
MNFEAKHIQKNYGKKVILKDISFHLESGTCMGIIGVNGCGKSTLLSILSGVTKPDHGKLLVTDASQVGLVPQENPLIADLSVKDNLNLWYTDASLRDNYMELLQITPFYKQTVSSLSGGQKKRVSIAIAMASAPSVLLLDEPGAALDLPCKYQIRDFLTHYVSLGNSVILTTHEEADLDICDSLYLLKDGVLTRQSTQLRGAGLLALLNSGANL